MESSQIGVDSVAWSGRGPSTTFLRGQVRVSVVEAECRASPPAHTQQVADGAVLLAHGGLSKSEHSAGPSS